MPRAIASLRSSRAIREMLARVTCAIRRRTQAIAFFRITSNAECFFVQHPAPPALARDSDEAFAIRA